MIGTVAQNITDAVHQLGRALRNQGQLLRLFVQQPRDSTQTVGGLARHGRHFL